MINLRSKVLLYLIFGLSLLSSGIANAMQDNGRHVKRRLKQVIRNKVSLVINTRGGVFEFQDIRKQGDKKKKISYALFKPEEKSNEKIVSGAIWMHLFVEAEKLNKNDKFEKRHKISKAEISAEVSEKYNNQADWKQLDETIIFPLDNKSHGNLAINRSLRIICFAQDGEGKEKNEIYMFPAQLGPKITKKRKEQLAIIKDEVVFGFVKHNLDLTAQKRLLNNIKYIDVIFE